MFKNDNLKEHLETSSVIKLNSAVVAEWNMNIAENIALSGNYRFRPEDTESPEYNFISQSFSLDDEINRFYTDATDADVVIDGGVEDDGTPLAFISKKEKERLLYSLEDCFGRFRPRSGINKLRYFENNFSHFSNIDMARRPRYYLSSKLDDFKYWTSYRTEDGIERGVANINLNGQNLIHDAAPFVVYKERVPANRIVVKTQTNVGELDLGPFVVDNENVSDPFFGDQNKTTPVRWRIQYLDQSDSWVDATVFDENSTRNDGSPIFGPDGYVEIFYGLTVPDQFRETFKYIKEVSSEVLLPDPTNFPRGTAYLLRTQENEPGTVYVVVNNADMTEGTYETFSAEYSWSVQEENVSSATGFVTDLTSPPSFTNPANQQRQFREFVFIKGLRVVVETMNVFDSTFDLIELSPRLTVNISDKVTSFSVTRSASDLGITGLPVGQLLASVGSLNLLDFDQAFFDENPNSIVAKYTSQNIQFKFYEVVQEVVGDEGFLEDFYIPIKTMYAEGFPQVGVTSREVTITLRDLFFYFESFTAPQILVPNVSLSYAISLLLDSVGFSNYVFLRNPGEDEEIIPFFFVSPDETLATVLSQLAVSTQSAMFFDEFNNFIVMSKGYILPKEEERETDIMLRGSRDFESEGAFKNKKTKNELANILDISFVNNQVFNDGVVNYTTRSIQRSYGTIQQASVIDKDKTWIYKPVLLWEVAPEESTRPVDDEIGEQSEYALTAIPLNSDLASDVPEVVNHRVINNTIDFGDGVYWTARYDGYFFANGEIIRYDAIQFSIPGLSQIDIETSGAEGDNVWISSTAEYQRYFSKIPFNGKMFPTGLVRIYSEPHFETVGGSTRLKNGFVAKHGRGQFGTEIVSHSAGLPERWSDISNRRGVHMDFKFLINQRINRVRYSDVTLQSNDETAILNVSDASLAKQDFVEVVALSEITVVSNTTNAILQLPTVNNIEVDMFVRNSGAGSLTTNVLPEFARIVSINTSSNRITISGEIENLDAQAEFSIRVGRLVFTDYVFREFDGGAEDAEGQPIPAPETNLIPNDTRILNVDFENNRIILDKKLENISTEEFFSVSNFSSVTIVRRQKNAILELSDVEDLEVGMYVTNQEEEVTNNIIPKNTRIIAINAGNNRITIDSAVTAFSANESLSISVGRISLGGIVLAELIPETTSGASGIDPDVFTNSSVSGVIKNILANQYIEEDFQRVEYPATVQASALVFKGNVINTIDFPRNYLSYVYKPLDQKFVHFGTRLRIIGKIENNETRGQTPEGSTTFYTVENTETGQSPIIAGGSGGLSIMVNPSTNEGYYFEVAALTENNLDEYSEDDEFQDDTARNVMFYKIARNADAQLDTEKAIPIKLFSGIAQVLVDDGTFVGQSRLSNEETTTVYDLAVEYKDENGVRIFFLYINNVMVGIVRDEDPLPIVNNMALFVRGNAKCMFENVYALADNYSQNTTFSLDTPVNSAFGNIDLNAQRSFQRYAVSGLVQSTYLSGISAEEPPKYNIYFEEFGTIMREAAYFNIRYDKAYPALYAKIAPTFNRVKGYTTTGFLASSYGAEFVVFNHTDTILTLDSSSGNYLRILGVTFTQQSVNELTVDDYFEKRTNFANPRFVAEGLVENPVDAKKYYTDIKLSRLTQGNKEFVMDAAYIQTKGAANRMMKWLVERVMKPRKSVGVRVFGMPTLQLGDIITFDYESEKQEPEKTFNQISGKGQRFVVYNIEYNRSLQDVSMNVFLSEVTE